MRLKVPGKRGFKVFFQSTSSVPPFMIPKKQLSYNKGGAAFSEGHILKSFNYCILNGKVKEGCFTQVPYYESER